MIGHRFYGGAEVVDRSCVSCGERFVSAAVPGDSAWDLMEFVYVNE